LDLSDLKQFSLNGIHYSSIHDEHKRYLKDEIFPKKWEDWVDSILDGSFDDFVMIQSPNSSPKK